MKKQILQNSFYQLISVYVVVIALISFGAFSKYSLYFQVLALIIAIFGITIIPKKSKEVKISKLIHYSLLSLSVILILVSRIIPYLKSSIPLGYDTGIYKFAIEEFSKNTFSGESWIYSALTPFFLYLSKILTILFSTEFILKELFIFFILLLGISIYFVSKKYFGKIPALTSILIYSISIIQFKIFEFMYYKNILALIFLMGALFFLEDKRKYSKYLFILFSALTGAMHRPTFFIFGLSYFFYAIISPYKYKKYNFETLKKNVLYGILIIILTAIFYIGFFESSLLPLIKPVAESFIRPGTSPGTFIDFFTYQFSILPYLPFALLGLFTLIKRKNFNLIFFGTITTLAIVYFQFFFFNRFIIHLDVFLIILSGLGASILIENKKKLGIIILSIILISSSFVIFNHAVNVNNVINENELSVIKELIQTESNSYVMSTNKIYSPWILGYSERRTIAPGLFDYNLHNKQEWKEFWMTNSSEEVQGFMNKYEKPLYIFIGEKQKNNLDKFPECFNEYARKENNVIYKYIC